MSEKKTNLGLSNPVIGLGVLTGAATLVTVILVLLHKPVAAAIIGTATAFLWLALIVATTAVVVSWWSATLMERGAQIALVAQTSDDKRDVAMIGALSKLTEWRETRPDRLALPLPSQEADAWLPQVTPFEIIDDDGR